MADVLSPILDADTGAAVTCERAFLAVLDGSCRTPIAGHARIEDGRVLFRGEVLAEDGNDWAAVERTGSNPETVGREAGHELLAHAPAGLIAALGA